MARSLTDHQSLFGTMGEFIPITAKIGPIVHQEADREEIPKVMNRASQGIINENLSRWKGDQEGDSSEGEQEE